MAKLTPRYSGQELETLLLCIYPEEDRPKYTREKWTSQGFRWYRAPNVICIEHLSSMPSVADRALPALPGTAVWARPSDTNVQNQFVPVRHLLPSVQRNSSMLPLLGAQSR
jgi:hypothetical protein